MDGKALYDELRTLARSLGITDIGVASAGMWETDDLVKRTTFPVERPSAILPGARSVIILGVPVQRTILATTPSTYYSDHSRNVNAVEDIAAQRLVMELIIRGHAAVSVARDGYQWNEELRLQTSSFFSHRHAAYLAGMGTFGVNNMILTERYGPRIRLASLITTAELPSGIPLDKQLCTKCMRCVSKCPVNATVSVLYPDGITDKKRCVGRATVLRSAATNPCAICTFVCPVGADFNDPMPEDDAVSNIRRYAN